MAADISNVVTSSTLEPLRYRVAMLFDERIDLDEDQP